MFAAYAVALSLEAEGVCANAVPDVSMLTTTIAAKLDSKIIVIG
jgi:hypothetical protein